jgi:hypothetical protein
MTTATLQAHTPIPKPEILNPKPETQIPYNDGDFSRPNPKP